MDISKVVSGHKVIVNEEDLKDFLKKGDRIWETTVSAVFIVNDENVIIDGNLLNNDKNIKWGSGQWIDVSSRVRAAVREHVANA